MSDNLFDRLFELFQTTDSVNWGLSEEIIKSVAGDRQPLEPQLAEEYQELALAASLQLASSGVLDADVGVVPEPIDPTGWAHANHRSYAYLLEPLATALGGAGGSADPLAAMMGPLGPALSGLQAGSMVGFMSHTVMGQFDAWLPTLDQSKAFVVIPNIEAFANTHSLDTRQVRLWATLQELVNHATLRRPSVRARIADDVADLIDGIDFDPARLMEKLGDLGDQSGLQAMLSDSESISALIGGERSSEASRAFETTAAFIAGWGDHLVERAAGSMLPDLAPINEAHQNRRAEAPDGADQLQQFVGLDLRTRQAADAAIFCADVVRRWGTDALDRVWELPENIPQPGELTDSIGWAARVLLD